MTTAPTACDTLLRADYLLARAEEPILRDAALAVKAGRVLAFGPREEMARHFQPRTRLDLGESLLMPGLVNAHTHIAMTLLRGVADDLPLHRWLTDYIFPREKKLDPSLVAAGASLACAELTRFGVTAFADMYLLEDAVFAAVASSGLRMLGGEVAFAFPSPAYANEDALFALVREQAARWQGHPRIRVAVMPHAVYTTTPALLEGCRDLADACGLTLHLHLAETRHEVAECRKAHGKSPVQFCADLGLLGPRTTIAHGVVFDDADLDILAASKAVVVHCPRSNMKLASGVARLPDMLARDIPVALGTDGAASSNNLNMFQEIATAALLHKVTAMDPTVAGAPEVLRMATENGGKALHQPELGCIRVGGVADIIALDLTQPNMRPVHSPLSNAVYAATGAEVRLTMVEGEILYKDGEYTRLDLEKIYADAAAAAKALG